MLDPYPSHKTVRGNIAGYRAFMRETLWSVQGGICEYCCNKMTADFQRHTSATLDHVIPKKSGGKDHADNLVLCCKGCNEARGSEIFDR